MDGETLFDISFNVKIERSESLGTTYIYESEVITFIATRDVLDLFSDDKAGAYSKIIYPVYRYNQKQIIPLIVSDTEFKKSLGITRKDLYVTTIQGLLNLIPFRIDDIKRWIIESLYLKNGKLGHQIDDWKNIDFFSFNDMSQLRFFIELLIEEALVEADITQYIGGNFDVLNLKIAKNGWKYIEEEILLGKTNNKQVFIAMWFDISMNNAYLSIKKAIENNGLIEMRIDKKDHNNDITSEIMYEIRNSKFLIADVTGQRQGVYFEAGYALGKGIPVIWTCRNDELSKVHFDTRQYNHIVWKDEDELEKLLVKRIISTVM